MAPPGARALASGAEKAPGQLRGYPGVVIPSLAAMSNELTPGIRAVSRAWPRSVGRGREASWRTGRLPPAWKSTEVPIAWSGRRGPDGRGSRGPVRAGPDATARRGLTWHPGIASTDRWGAAAWSPIGAPVGWPIPRKGRARRMTPREGAHGRNLLLRRWIPRDSPDPDYSRVPPEGKPL
jgi:hypothetical protein